MKTTKLFAAAATLLAAGTALAGTMVIKMKDGTTAAYDTAQIESVRFSESGARSAREGKALYEENFAGSLSAAWEKSEVAGGNFDKFARATGGAFEVSVPAGNSWGKTGIVSRDRLLTVNAGMEENPLKLKLTFDPDKTTGFCIALAESKVSDVYWTTNMWFHFGRKSLTETTAGLANTRNDTESYTGDEGPSEIPETVTFTVKPGFIRAETSTGIAREGKFSWLKPGVSAYLYVFSHPMHQNDPSTMALKSIRLYR
ncbi:MAG: hypothetical protein HY927_01810 [Elusimicrobia bacterium]|nr:hypothetical protein [Elusimicrobiota bacterium]